MMILPPSVENLITNSISRVRRIYILRGAAITLASLLAGALAVMMIDAKFTIFSESARWWMSIALYALVLGTAALALLRPLLRRIDHRRMAEILDGRHPEHEECLQTLVEIKDAADRKGTPGCSEQLLTVLEAKAASAASRLTAESEFTTRTVVRRLHVLMVFAGLLAVSFIVFPHLAGRLFVRAIAPWVDVGNLYANDITVIPGDINALAGTLVRIEAKVIEDIDAEPVIRISRRTGGGWGEEFAEPMKAGAYEFIADLDDAEWRYRISAGPAITRYHRVMVFEMPKCESFVANIEYPAYTKFPAAAYSNEEATTIQAIEGSVVRFEARPLRRDVTARLFIDGIETNAWLAVSNNVASWRLAVANAAGFTAPDHCGTIRSFPDAPPTVIIESPDTGVLDLPPHAKFPLEITASDDVGITMPELIVTRAGARPERWRSIGEYTKTGPSLWRGRDSIDLASLELDGVGSVEFAVAVSDNCPARFDGPHCVTSAPVVVRLADRALNFEMQELARVVDESKRMLAEAENRIGDAVNASWNDPERAIHEANEARKRLEELGDVFADDERFRPIADDIRRMLKRRLEPALERLRDHQYSAQDKRAESLRETLPELKEALEQLKRLEKPFAERARELENAERVDDLLRRERSLERAAEHLAAEFPRDAERLEAWKRMQDEVARETAEMINALDDRQVDEAWRQMKKAMDLVNRLKEDIAIDADESKSEDAKRQAKDELQRRDEAMRRDALARAIEYERAAEAALDEAARHAKDNPAYADDQKRQAMNAERTAADLAAQADASRDALDALKRAAEKLDTVMDSAKSPAKALEASLQARHELERELGDIDKAARERAADEAAAERVRAADDNLRNEAANHAAQAADKLDSGNLDEARAQARAASDKLSAAEDIPEALVKAEEDAVAAIDDLKALAEDVAEAARLAESAVNEAASAEAALREAEAKRQEAERLADEAAAAQANATSSEAQKSAAEAQARADKAASEAAKSAEAAMEQARSAAEAHEAAAMAAGDNGSVKAAEELRDALEQAAAAQKAAEAKREHARELAAEAMAEAAEAMARAEAADEALAEAKASGERSREDTVSRQTEAAKAAADDAKKHADEMQRQTRNQAEIPSSATIDMSRIAEKTAEADARAEAARHQLADAQRDIADALRKGVDGSSPVGDLTEAVERARENIGALAKSRRDSRDRAHAFAAERALSRTAAWQQEAAMAFAADDDALAAEALRSAQQSAEKALDGLRRRLDDERLTRDAVKALKDAIEAEAAAMRNRQEAINQAAAAANSHDGNQKMLARQFNEAAEGLEEQVAEDMAAVDAGTMGEDGDDEALDGGQEIPPSTPESAARRARENLERSSKRRGRALGTGERRESEGELGGESLDSRIDSLARELKRADDPDAVRKLFEETGWFRIRGAAKDGLGEHELKDIPAEYRDLVRLYFLKLAE